MKRIAKAAAVVSLAIAASTAIAQSSSSASRRVPIRTTPRSITSRPPRSTVTRPT